MPPVAPGSRLGPYEIVAAIGAGGMGEVWRASDPRLEREVAIKILPAAVSHDEQLRLRFEREARAVSQLNHPHICTLHDVGVEDDGDQAVHYLVMELLDGEGLDARLERGPLPPAEVLSYGRQIASAVDAAHRLGIVHRDLKPANVMLTGSGAKLLDFGLAKTAAAEGPPLAGLTILATEERPLTQEGTLLGTFQYMAPEQLEGREADARTDLFALGALLYEMATGRRAFAGDSKTEQISAIVSSQPEPISAVVPGTSPALDHVVRRCLEKDPEDRWQSAHDVAGQLEWIAEAGSQAGVPATVTVRRKTRERLAWAAAAGLAIALAASFWSFRTHLGNLPEPTPGRFEITAPEGSWLGSVRPSPDGRSLLLSIWDGEGNNQLWVRSVATGELRELDGAAYSRRHVWSPDGGWIAYYARGRLFKLQADGSSRPIELAVLHNPRGRLAWSPDGTILGSQSWDTPLFRIPATGGALERATELRPGEEGHRDPVVLADGTILFGVRSTGEAGTQELEGIYALAPGGSAKKLLPANRDLWWATERWLLTLDREGSRVTLWELHLDSLTLGPPREVSLPFASIVQGWGELLGLGVVLAKPLVTEQQATWYDRSGKILKTLGEPGNIGALSLSRDDRRALLDRWDAEAQRNQLEDYELSRGLGRVVASTLTGYRPIWLPDGRRFLWSVQTEPGRSDIVEHRLGASGEPSIVVEGKGIALAAAVSVDGSLLYYETDPSDESWDLWLTDLQSPSERTRVVDAPPGASAAGGDLSPDGRWLAYQLDDSGRTEVFAKNLSGGPVTRISASGGVDPKWRRDGAELFFANSVLGEMMAVPVTGEGEELVFGEPQRLFSAPVYCWNGCYDVTRAGDRFLVLTRPAFRPTTATVLLDWFTEVVDDR